MKKDNSEEAWKTRADIHIMRLELDVQHHEGKSAYRICIHVHLYEGISMYACTCICIHINQYIGVRVRHVRVCVHMCICILYIQWGCMCVGVRIYVNI